MSSSKLLHGDSSDHSRTGQNAHPSYAQRPIMMRVGGLQGTSTASSISLAGPQIRIDGLGRSPARTILSGQLTYRYYIVAVVIYGTVAFRTFINCVTTLNYGTMEGGRAIAHPWGGRTQLGWIRTHITERVDRQPANGVCLEHHCDPGKPLQFSLAPALPQS